MDKDTVAADDVLVADNCFKRHSVVVANWYPIRLVNIRESPGDDRRGSGGRLETLGFRFAMLAVLVVTFRLLR